ncbi:MAG: biotin carboxylase N-terminal domain-containing protein [Actinomycetota bacterium]
MFSRVLIANRGEIAVRVARTCRELGVGTIAVFSDVDERARHVTACDEAVRLPGVAPSETYLNLDAVIAAARSSGAQAVHPGYGFLSERADAARAVAEAGLVWVGPPPEATAAVGDKIHARRLAEQAGVPVVPGTAEPVGSVEEVLAFGELHGYPVAIKASGGGGGRGFRVVMTPGDAEDALAAAAREAEAAFGSPDVYLERYLSAPKHVEVQILGTGPGDVLWLGARDCSLQRRHQKLTEETPPPLHAGLVPELGEAAAAVAKACGYVNAGTVEFLVDEDGSFFFLEVNARLQVEHTITEEVLGVDLVAAQLRIAAGDDLDFAGPDLEPRGHAIECRINAEDPARSFAPTPGRITAYREPGGPGVRVDSGYNEGDEVPGAYDSLIAKLIVWARTREEARLRMLRSLDEFVIEGVATTIPAHRALLRHPTFVDGSYTTRTVEEGALASLEPPVSGEPDRHVLVVGGRPVRLWHPAIGAAATGAAPAGSGGVVVSPMHGTVIDVLVKQGDEVRQGDPVAVLETMKMETRVEAAVAGTVTSVNIESGAVVESGEVIATIS